MAKNKVVINEKDAWSNLANFIGEMLAKYGDELELDSLPDPKVTVRVRRLKQLYREFYKQKNLVKYRGVKLCVDKEKVA